VKRRRARLRERLEEKGILHGFVTGDVDHDVSSPRPALQKYLHQELPIASLRGDLGGRREVSFLEELPGSEAREVDGEEGVARVSRPGVLEGFSQ